MLLFLFRKGIFYSWLKSGAMWSIVLMLAGLTAACLKLEKSQQKSQEQAVIN